MTVWRQLRSAVILLLLMTLLTGVFYPLVVTGMAQGLLPHQANGSLMERGWRIVGSESIGQPFDEAKYFWGRLSATTPPYNAGASSGSNLGPLNPALVESAKARVDALRKADPNNAAPIPVDLVTSSGSGLDPHISVAAALYQAPRVARARGLDEAAVHALVMRHVEDRQFAALGEKRVNVLKLNLSLDGLE